MKFENYDDLKYASKQYNDSVEHLNQTKTEEVQMWKPLVEVMNVLANSDDVTKWTFDTYHSKGKCGKYTYKTSLSHGTRGFSLILNLKSGIFGEYNHVLTFYCQFDGSEHKLIADYKYEEVYKHYYEILKAFLIERKLALAAVHEEEAQTIKLIQF